MTSDVRPPMIFMLIRGLRIAPLPLLALLLLFHSGVVAPQELAAAQDPAGIPVTGQITDPDGRPLPGVIVQLVRTGRSALTDRDGRFRLDPLSPGDHTVRIRAVGFAEREVILSDVRGQSPLAVVLDPAPLPLREVVVTATPSRGAAAYQATQVLHSEELRRLSSLSVGVLLDGQPGVAARQLGPAPARPVIRGFDGERVVVLENGQRMADTQQRAPDDAVSLDPLAIDRIEVVRGPASLLHGSSALGGVVNLFTRDIPEAWAPGLSGEVALDGASVNGMLAGSGLVLYGTDRLGVTARGSFREAGDAATPAGPMPNSHVRALSASTGFGFQASRFRGGLSAGLHFQDHGVPEFSVVQDEAAPAGFREEEPEAEILMERFTVQGRGEWSLDRWVSSVELRALASTSEQEESDDDLDGEDEEPEQEIHMRVLGSTLLLRHRPAGFFGPGAFGLSLRVQHQEIEGVEAYHPGERLLSVGGFLFEEVPLLPNLRLQAGARIENEWTRTLPNVFFGPEEAARASALNLAGSVGLNLRPAPGLELGAQFARAHRNPTVVERYASGWDVGAGRVELGQEDLSTEIGHGVDVFGSLTTDRLRLELAGFVYRIQDYVTVRNLPLDCGGVEYRVRPQRDFPTCVQYFAADAEMRGGEGSLEILLTRKLRALVILDHVRGTRLDGARQPLPFIPPARLSTKLVHDAGSWFAGAEARWVAPQERVPDDELPTPGHELLMLEAGYRLNANGRHLMSLRLDNALNARYADHLSHVRRYPEPVSPTNPARFEMSGRSLHLSYRYRF